MGVMARGIVFTGPGQVELETFEVQDPGPQQVLVRTTRTLVSAGTEVKALLNLRGAGDTGRYPVRPGYSSVGVVEAVGSAVQDVRPRDRVLTMGRHASHTLVDLDPNRLAATAGQRAPQYLQKLPDDITDEQAVFAILGSVALHGMRKVSFQLGESCAVMGQGVVGQLLGQLARAAGAAPVIGIDLVAARLEQSRRSGLHGVVDASKEDAVEAVLRLTGGRGADVAFEATTSARNFPALLRLAALNGRIVIVGSLTGTVEISLYEEIQRKELTIIGAWQPRAPVVLHHTFPWSQQRNRQVFLELIRAGALRVDHLITRRGRPEDARRLYGEIAAGPGDWLGVMFVWD
jgi:2-desacetyl-2-hydroxyethyl bacteriochlorophyllide A dehydrogenase